MAHIPTPYPQPGSSGTTHHGANCSCPSCHLGLLMGRIYASQFPKMYGHLTSTQQESGSALAAPSSAAVLSPPKATPPRTERCPMYSAYGWCIYGVVCLFRHTDGEEKEDGPTGASAAAQQQAPSNGPTSPQYARKTSIAQEHSDKSAEELVVALTAMVAEHLGPEPQLRCRVCGFDKVPKTNLQKVGEMGCYLVCPECTSMMYQPLVQHLVHRLLQDAADDYQLFKTLVDSHRARLPNVIRIPFSYESHRVASTHFAWSLVSPEDGAAVFVALRRDTSGRNDKGATRRAGGAASGEGEEEEVLKAEGGVDTLVSVGCGTGYVEHVFNLAWTQSNGGLTTQAPSVPPLRFFAFDEIERPARFSVRVQYGTPGHIVSLDDCTNTVLLLCWPPFGSPDPNEQPDHMAYDSLCHFLAKKGRYVIYVGDVASTGDYSFQLLLHTHFAPLPEYRARHAIRRWVPQDLGLVYAGNDTLGVYRRRETPLETNDPRIATFWSPWTGCE